MQFVPQSLTVKIALVVLLVSLTSVGLVAFFSGWITMRAYDQLVLDQLRTNFAEAAATYYEGSGSWTNFAQAFAQFGGDDGPPASRRRDMRGDNPAVLFPFTLVDTNGCVVGPANQQYAIGDCSLPAAQVNGGKAVMVDNQRVGTVVMTGTVPTRDPREEAFLQNIGRGLFLGAVGAGALALLLGIGLATTLTRPLRRLTDAIHAMAAGNLEQRVDVRSKDEIGELASAFNSMSTQLVQSNKARRQMTADIAHELRNPLMVMTGYLEALRDGVLQPTPTRFETLYDEALHLQRLVTDLRTLSLADAGELSLQRQRVPAALLLTRVTEAYGPAAAQQGVALIATPAADTLQIAVDVERMVQVLANLVTNALRYTPAGGSITLCAAPDPTGVALSVADTGAGIAPDILPHIFDRFYRGDQARSGDNGESGLGLAIVKSIVSAHDGTISVTSTVHAGTTFTIRLPAA